MKREVETKVQSSWWIGQSSSPSRKPRMSKSNAKIILIVVFDWQGVVHSEFVQRGSTINSTLK